MFCSISPSISRLFGGGGSSRRSAPGRIYFREDREGPSFLTGSLLASRFRGPFGFFSADLSSSSSSSPSSSSGRGGLRITLIFRAGAGPSDIFLILERLRASRILLQAEEEPARSPRPSAHHSLIPVTQRIETRSMVAPIVKLPITPR